MLFVTGLSIFHCVLKCKGKTTREYLKNRDKVVGKGISNDWFKSSPSIMDYRYKMTEEKKYALQNYRWDRGGPIVAEKKDKQSSRCSLASCKQLDPSDT